MGNTKSGKSGYFGVSWHSAAKKWAVYIRNGKKPEYVGLYSDAKEAALAYDKRAKELGKKLFNFSEDEMRYLQTGYKLKSRPGYQLDVAPDAEAFKGEGGAGRPFAKKVKRKDGRDIKDVVRQVVGGAGSGLPIGKVREE